MPGKCSRFGGLTKAGKAVRRSMTKQYGKKAGRSIFYASRRKGLAGSSKWFRKKRKG